MAEGTLVGYTAHGVDSADELDELIGRDAEVVRVYNRKHTPTPTSSADAEILAHVEAGRRVVLSLGADSGDQADNCQRLATDIADRGYASMVWICPYHEPYNELSAEHYLAVHAALAPAFQSRGIAYGPILQDYPYHRGAELADWIPADTATWDYLGIDTYPGSDPRGKLRDSAGSLIDPLSTISSFTSFAKSRGKVFGVAEFGVQAELAADDPDGATAYLERFGDLGTSAAFLTYWNGSARFDLTANDGLLIPVYRALFDALDPPRRSPCGS